MDLSEPGSQLVFSVAPLARGRLIGAALEVQQPDFPVQNIRLRMKSTTQCLTWFLLLLTLFLPPLYLYEANHQMEGLVHKKITKEKEKPDGDGGMQPDAARPDAANDQADDDEYVIQVPWKGGMVLRDRIEYDLADFLPDFPQKKNIMDQIARTSGNTYDFLCNLPRDSHFAFWLGASLLILTVISWLLHRPQRTTFRKVIAVKNVSTGGASTSEPVPLIERFAH